jgi:hypothetical protein
MKQKIASLDIIARRPLLPGGYEAFGFSCGVLSKAAQVVAFRGQASCVSVILILVMLLKTKLLALCERGTDLPDCIDLAPTVAEFAEALPRVAFQDANPDLPAHVAATLADLGRRLGHGV